MANGDDATTIIGVDPIGLKRDFADQPGGTHVVAEIGEAADLARSFTKGQGADSSVICVGVARSEDVVSALRSIRKGGTVVLTAAPSDERLRDVPMLGLTFFHKRIPGLSARGVSPNRDISRWAAQRASMPPSATNSVPVT